MSNAVFTIIGSPISHLVKMCIIDSHLMQGGFQMQRPEKFLQPVRKDIGHRLLILEDNLFFTVVLL